MTLTAIGFDVAKLVFQVHGVDENSRAVLKRKLHRHEVATFFEGLPRCTVFLEACGASHHWARLLTALGHEVKLIAPEAVKPFVKKGKKNDAVDAAALCVAGSRPEIQFVPIKSVAQQAVLALHTARSLLVKQQTMLANAIRGLASEFGLVVPQGLHRLEELMVQVTAEASVPAEGRQALIVLHAQLQAAEERTSCSRSRSWFMPARTSARRLATIPGRADHGLADRSHGGRQHHRLHECTALCGLAWARSSPALHGWQATAWPDHESRQYRDPPATGAGRHLDGPTSRNLEQCRRDLATRCAGAAAGAADHGGAREQDGTDRLGIADAQRCLPGAGALQGGSWCCCRLMRPARV